METSNPSHLQEYLDQLARVQSGELVIPGWDEMSEREKMEMLSREHAADLDQIAAVKYQPAGGKG